MSFTNAQLSDLSRCARLPEGQLFVELLKMRLAEHDAKLRTATGEDLPRTQGKAQAVPVCGLHVEHNLTVIPAQVNRAKRNHFDPEDYR